MCGGVKRLDLDGIRRGTVTSSIRKDTPELGWTIPGFVTGGTKDLPWVELREGRGDRLLHTLSGWSMGCQVITPKASPAFLCSHPWDGLSNGLIYSGDNLVR